MKKVILTLALAFTIFSINAQVDSSKIVKEQNLEKELENLEDGAEQFSKQIQELSKQIVSLDAEKQSEATSDERKKEIEAKIDDLELQINALEKGIADIEIDIESSENRKDGKKHNDDDDNGDDDDDDGFDFDWDEFDFDFWPLNKKKKFNGHWAGFEIGLTNFVNADNQFELPANGSFLELDPVKSGSYSLNFMEFNIPLHKKYFGLVTGVGFEWKSYTLETNGYLIYNEQGNTDFQEVDYTISRNKFNVNSFTFPLLAEIQIPMGKKDKRISLSGGVIGSIRVSSSTSQQWEEGKTDNYFRQEADYNLSTFKYAYTARIGYRGFQVFANYEVMPLFEEGKGPEVYPISFGIRLLDF